MYFFFYTSIDFNLIMYNNNLIYYFRKNLHNMFDIEHII